MTFKQGNELKSYVFLTIFYQPCYVNIVNLKPTQRMIGPIEIALLFGILRK